MMLRVYASADELTQAAAAQVTDACEVALKAHGRFTLVLSGGSTPKALYALLVKQPLDWGRVFVFWGDERCVPPDHSDSNYRMARETLLDRVPIPTGNIHRMRGEDDPAQAAADYERVISSFFQPGVVRLDLVLLGMGDDGHTASLFPHTAALN
ncbi:MAG: 6-phosphogluconolactonase, partial [Anaerolineae bacterium]|nr:6-phosphogluconolactonase [Anaerolineae bacterium]